MKIIIDHAELNDILDHVLPERVPLQITGIRDNAFELQIKVVLLKLRFTLSNPSIHPEGWLRFDVNPPDISAFVNLLLRFKPELAEKVRTRPGKLAVLLPEDVRSKFILRGLEFEDGRIRITGDLNLEELLPQ